MSYKALYRTYRPDCFDEVAGQHAIVQTLKNALKENKIAHAYLFSGPRGTGKTTMARIFAKALNCEEGFGKQCNQCENCLAITEGRHPDVIEIDAASNRGIDDIRDLISKVKYSPIMGTYKVYIIDEVHMMTTEAFNALLKTLEEPPERVVFILATTEPYKLMPTILSRCQRYDFSKVDEVDLMPRLIKICEKENVNYQKEALEAIISLSDGGVRDALSMLDQTIAYCKDNISLQAIEDLYGLSSKSQKIEIIKYLSSSDLILLTNKVNELAGRGVDIKRLTSDLIEVLKDLLIYQTTKEVSLLKVLNKDDVLSFNLKIKDINMMIDIFLSTLSSYKMVNNIKSMFEISLLKIASNMALVKEEVKEVVEEVVVETKKTVEEKVVEEVVKPVVTTPKKPSFFSVNKLSENGEEIIFNQDDIINIMVQASKDKKIKLNESWFKLDNLLFEEGIGKYADLLKTCSPRIVSSSLICLESNYLRSVKQINLKENQYGLAKVIEHINGTNCNVICLTHQEYISAVNKFTNLQQANKLPTPNPITIEFK